MENQTEENMEKDVETGFAWVFTLCFAMSLQTVGSVDSPFICSLSSIELC